MEERVHVGERLTSLPAALCLCRTDSAWLPHHPAWSLLGVVLHGVVRACMSWLRPPRLPRVPRRGGHGGRTNERCEKRSPWRRVARSCEQWWRVRPRWWPSIRWCRPPTAAASSPRGAARSRFGRTAAAAPPHGTAGGARDDGRTRLVPHPECHAACVVWCVGAAGWRVVGGQGAPRLAGGVGLRSPFGGPMRRSSPHARCCPSPPSCPILW